MIRRETGIIVKMTKNKIKLTKILVSFGIMVLTAIIATVAWFHFTVHPDLKMKEFQSMKQGSMKLSAEENGEDIGLNGEIELDIDNRMEELYPGSSGSLTVWITSSTSDIISYILTYTEPAPDTDPSVFEKAKDIIKRHILLFAEREVLSETPATDSAGNPVTDENGEQAYDYVYSYSTPLLPVGEYSESEDIPPYRIYGQLPMEVPQKVTIYWVWPYDYEDYGKYGDYGYLFPPAEEGAETEDDGLTDAERYDDEDSFIGKVVNNMRFRFYVNGKRNILELTN